MSLGTVDDAEFQAWANRVKGKVQADVIKKEIGDSRSGTWHYKDIYKQIFGR